MGKSLKDALLKAGLTSTKTQNDRDSAKGRVQKKSEKHQHTRNFCEVCEAIYPDVERYKHRNPTIDAQWICVSCADKNMIDDEFRVTHQSDMAKKGMFKRFYGATKKFDQKAGNFKGGDSRKPNCNANGNQRNSNRSSNNSNRRKPKSGNY